MEAPEPIDDDELLYRRISAKANPQLYIPAIGFLGDRAFAPTDKDQTGLSVFRKRYKSIEQAARGTPGISYYVAVLRAGDLRKHGIRVEPQPNVPGGYDVSHAELPDMNAANRRDSATLERMQLLVQLCREVQGPFVTPIT